MGMYINPGNSGFARIVRSNYVDKTGLIALMNERFGKDDSLVCVSRPRRFGKSYAAKMLTAYYDCSCDSHELFDDKEIAKSKDYEKYLNQYNVICLDITGFISTAQREGRPLTEIPSVIVKAVWEELVDLYPDLSSEKSLEACMIRSVEKEGGKPFVFIIDEWDALIREAKDSEEAQKRYLNLLRGWFKNTNFTPKAVAAAYMTGILPIKKDGSQSAISDFQEFSMVKPRIFGTYVGFTEGEVWQLCNQYQADFQNMKRWYDGYRFKGIGSVYNPNSVMQAIKNGDFDSYWVESSAAKELLDYNSKDYNGLTKTIAELIGGVEVKVNTAGFANDLTSFSGKDDVLTLLIHLGYLAYDEDRKTVFIPNKEIRQEFQRSIHEVKQDLIYE